MYNNHFVVCVLIDGKPQKERKDGIVLIPYDSEYSLRFRNKNNKRAVVQFTIDGEDVSGPGYIIKPNDSIDIHRHSNKDARFKFVSLDSDEAIDHGKNDNSDGSKGVIEAKFFLGKDQINLYKDLYFPNPPYLPYPTYPWMHSWNNNWGSYNINSNYNLECNSASSTPFADGCTVQGGISGQMFTEEHIDLEDSSVTIKLVLKGIASEEKVVVNYCTHCGTKKSRKSDRFCGLCGFKFS